MSLTQFSERISEALIRATGRHEAARSSGPTDNHDSGWPRHFSITISREAGTRGPEVARAAADRLGWPVYDHELLELVASDLHVRVKLLESIDERHVPWLQECVEAFAAVPAVRERKYVRHLIEVMLSLAAHGRCVVVGRGSPFVFPPATTLRVRLVASLEDRIVAVSREHNVSRHDAARIVDHTDRERLKFARLHFRRDPTDLRHYDLIVNTAQFDVPECADLIVTALRSKLESGAAAKGSAQSHSNGHAALRIA